MNTNRQRVLAELRSKIRTCKPDLPLPDRDTISTGSNELDSLLPGQGIHRGSLVEWIGAGGAGTLSLWTIPHLATRHRPAIVVDSQRQVYPLSLHFGIDPQALILVRPENKADSLWAIEQALRCEAVSVVWGITDHLTPTTYRRLKLAAERAGSVGFLLRPIQALKQPTWADVRLVVEPRPSVDEPPCFHVRVDYSRGGQVGQASVTVQIDGERGMIRGVNNTDETPVMSLVS